MTIDGGDDQAGSSRWREDLVERRLNVPGGCYTGPVSGYPSPILGVIGGGGGKTSLLRSLAAQQLRHGWPASFVDLRDEHGWADGLAGVARWTTVEDAESGLVDLGRELERRDRLEAQAAPWLLLIDDIDVLLPRLGERWNDRRQSGDPAMGPAISAWAEIWLRGRGLAIHAIVTASRPDRAFWADVAGTRVIGAGAPRSTWEAVAPEATPPVNDHPHPGRVWMLSRDESEPIETQSLWMTGTQARQFATDSLPKD